jgi:tol-pal system protein YbgF
MVRWQRRAALILGAVACGGCATRADLAKVKRELREQRALVADTQLAVDNLRRQLDSMRITMSEEGRRGPGSASARDLERRLAELERRALTAGGIPTDGGLAVPPVAPQATPGTPAAAIAWRVDESLATAADPNFRAALDLYRQSQYEKAALKFRDFIRTAPKSDLADNAQYWIGECYYAQRDYNRAIMELNEVLTRYARGDRVPAALLALATAFADSGDTIDAKLILQKLISEHSATEEAGVGRRRLQSLPQ